MTKGASANLYARAARESDLPFLGTLVAKQAARPDNGFTYPACESSGALMDELCAYGLALEQAMMIVEQAGKRVGSFGFLYDPNAHRKGAAAVTAFLIGPLLAGTGHDLMNDVLNIAERDAAGRDLQELRTCIAPANRGLVGTFTRRKWMLVGRSIEMKLECGHENRPVAADPAVRSLQPGSAHIDEAARLLADAFGWDADAERLKGYIDDGYQMAYVAQDGELAAVAIWYGVAPFARIENIVVRSDRRRCGLGSMLLRAAVASLQSMGRETVYLALDPDNSAACNLYRRHGFVETTASTIYGLYLRS
jgi:ribosomal protein S18 acetylase RimI-like enzyme